MIAQSWGRKPPGGREKTRIQGRKLIPWVFGVSSEVYIIYLIGRWTGQSRPSTKKGFNPLRSPLQRLAPLPLTILRIAS
jgi:hypothetical protein